MKEKIIILLVCTALLVGMLSGCVEEPTPTNNAPVASFTASDPVNKTVEFTSTATDADGDDLTYSWTFGDNIGTSTDANPSYEYASNGIYTVTLTVNDGTVDSEPASATVTIGTAPTAGITAPTGNITVNTSASFTDNSTKGDSNITSWSWDFGDGTGASTEQNPSYNYTDVGTYIVTLIVSDNDGLTDTTTAEVTVVAAEE